MEIDKDGVIGGQPIKAVRDLLRWIRRRGSTSEGEIADHLTIDTGATKALLDEMIAQNLLETMNVDGGDGPRYHEGDAGPRFGAARLLKRIDRKKADMLVADFVRRAREINARPELLMMVKEVRAFGSYITERTDLGDVDLAVRLERKPVENWVERSIERAEASGLKGLLYIDEVTFGEREVMRILKARNRYIEIHSMDDLEKRGIEGRRIYIAPSSEVRG
jgi:hypothetical protein